MSTPPMNGPQLSPTFRRVTVPGTGRTAVQLTEGEAFCYPLYYFIPSVTSDGRYLVYHCERPGTPNDIQLWKLDLRSGEHSQLTSASGKEADWKPWGNDPACGVLGDRSALNTRTGDVVYFEEDTAHCVNLHEGTDRELFVLPANRFPLAQNCVTGDGEFVYVRVAKDAYWKLLEARLERDSAFRERAHECEATEMCAYNLETGEHRILFRINYPIHHVHAYGRRHIAFSHIPGDRYGLGVSDTTGDWYAFPRPQDERGGKIIHHVPTDKGIFYEVKFRDDAAWVGLVDPVGFRKYEWTVPGSVSHVGCDPAGRLFFYHRGDGSIHALRRHIPDGDDDWTPIMDAWNVYGAGQKTHYHPRLVLDGQFMQLVAGDAASKTNHIYLIDVSDLEPTAGLPGVV